MPAIRFTRNLVFLTALLLSTPASACPDGFARIPADKVFTQDRYCLATHEMKNVDNKAVSTAEGDIWHLAHYGAKEKCQELGYDLPTNDLWQSMARNAERIPSNWTGGAVGQGQLKGTVTIKNSTGEVIFYNVGDSVWEHVDGKIKKPFQRTTTAIEDMDPELQEKRLRIKGLTKRPVKDQFGPEGTYTSAGLGIAVFRSAYIMRGGDDQDPGIFGFATNHGPYPESDADDVGFRCACRWADCRSENDPLLLRLQAEGVPPEQMR